MKIAAKKTEKASLKINEAKWTKPLIEAGFTVIPSVILDRQKALALDPIDVNILLHLAKHWWQRDNPPHPSKVRIATCMGISPSTVRKRIARMEADGLIHRVERFPRCRQAQQHRPFWRHGRGTIPSGDDFRQGEVMSSKEARLVALGIDPEIFDFLRRAAADARDGRRFGGDVTYSCHYSQSVELISRRLQDQANRILNLLLTIEDLVDRR